MPTPCRTEVRCALPLTGLNQRDRGACRTTQGDMWLSLLRDRLQEPVFAQRRRVQNSPKKEREQRVAVSWEGRSLPTSTTRESTQRGDGQTDGGGSWWNGMHPGHFPPTAQLRPTLCGLFHSCQLAFSRERVPAGHVHIEIPCKESAYRLACPRKTCRASGQT